MECKNSYKLGKIEEKQRILKILEEWIKRHFPSIDTSRSYSTMRNNINELLGEIDSS